MDLDTYELVLLRRPPDATAYPEAELDRIQDRHLAFLDERREAGQLVLAGPVWDQPDERLRGICLYRVGDLTRAQAIAESDPAVRAGRLAVEVMHFACPAGVITALPHAVPDHGAT
jgi:uncharacterized protein